MLKRYVKQQARRNQKLKLTIARMATKQPSSIVDSFAANAAIEVVQVGYSKNASIYGNMMHILCA